MFIGHYVNRLRRRKRLRLKHRSGPAWLGKISSLKNHGFHLPRKSGFPPMSSTLVKTSRSMISPNLLVGAILSEPQKLPRGSPRVVIQSPGTALEVPDSGRLQK